MKKGERDGAVLIVVLWILIILALLVSTMAFEMQVEAEVTSFYRKRFKAQHLSRAGMEWAKMLLLNENVRSEDMEELDPGLYLSAQLLNRGVAVQGLTHQLGEGEFQIDLVPEQGRRNVNNLSEDDWREILDQSRVPDDKWDELISTFKDWIDADDLDSIPDGAESEDEFYEDRGYEVKNAPLDTVDELLLIKGFTPEIVFGGPGELEDDPPLLGIAQWLTTWGDGRVNVNTASAEVLLSLPDVDDWMIDAIMEGRAGLDGEFGTEDDGFSSNSEVLSVTGLGESFGARITTTERRFLRVTSIGEVKGVRAGIWAVMRQDGGRLVPVYWREEYMK